MKGLLEKFCNDKGRKSGLLLVDLPTGFGKTYTVAQYIAENYEKIDGKIIFVTQLKKNFPADELRKCFREVGKEHELDKLMLIVENNVVKSNTRIDGLMKDWQLNNIRNWEAIRDFVLRHPTLDTLEGTLFPELYIELPEEGNRYYCRENELKKREVSFQKVSGFEVVDEKEVMLTDVMKIPGMKEYFVAEGYAVTFKKAKFILAYNVLKRVYQGALGETAGRYILDRKLLKGMDLYFKNMPPELYEKFDNMLADRFYIDFKLWKGTYDPTYENELRKIRSKLRKTDLRKVLYVNIIKPYGKKVKPYQESSCDPILSILYLFDPQNYTWNIEGLKKLYQVILEMQIK